jgi:hypothetical protein
MIAGVRLRTRGALTSTTSYEDVSKIFRTHAVKIINLTTKRVLKLTTSTQLCATWHTDSLDAVVLPSTGASRYHNCCIDGGTSPEYFGYSLVYLCDLTITGTTLAFRFLAGVFKFSPDNVFIYVFTLRLRRL